MSNGADCIAEALTPTGLVRGRHALVEHIDSEIGLGSLTPTRLKVITRNV
jgi:hypothetical protein